MPGNALEAHSALSFLLLAIPIHDASVCAWWNVMVAIDRCALGTAWFSCADCCQGQWNEGVITKHLGLCLTDSDNLGKPDDIGCMVIGGSGGCGGIESTAGVSSFPIHLP